MGGSGTLIGLTNSVLTDGLSGATFLMGGPLGSIITFGIVLALIAAVVYGIYKVMNMTRGGGR